MTGQTTGANKERGGDILVFQGLALESWLCWGCAGFARGAKPASCSLVSSLGVCLSFPLCRAGGEGLEAARGSEGGMWALGCSRVPGEGATNCFPQEPPWGAWNHLVFAY